MIGQFFDSTIVASIERVIITNGATNENLRTENCFEPP